MAMTSLSSMSATRRDLSLAIEDAARATVESLAADARVKDVKSIAFVKLNLPDGMGALTPDSNDIQVFEATLASKAGSFSLVTHDTHAEEWTLIDGIFNGVGSVLSFLPLIVVLFFFLSILEDSGYMARVAFVMDKPLRRIGLSGRSIVPMLIGFGCTVPGVMATRTLPSERDRKMTILLTPYMSCNAKMPIYGLFAAAFFGGKKALVYIPLYILGILCGLIMARVTRKFLFKGEAVPFVMELPNYRMPTPSNVARLLWEKAKDFIERAFSVIFIATMVIWFLQTFSPRLNMVTDSRDSILAAVANLITPVLRPLGFADWRICVALIAGFMAKESVVSTLSVLFGSIAALQAALPPAAAVGLLVFCLLYTPCVAAVSSFKRELGGKWALGIVAEQCIVAWIVAFIIRLISLALGLA